MKKVEEVKRYGDLKKGNIYRRGLLEEYVEKYRCMLIEVGAKRGIVSNDYTDNCIDKDIIYLKILFVKYSLAFFCISYIISIYFGGKNYGIRWNRYSQSG